MKRVVTFQHSIRDRVMITEIQRPGIVEGMTVDNNGITYSVVYWNDGERCQNWLYDEEIEDIDGEEDKR